MRAGPPERRRQKDADYMRKWRQRAANRGYNLAQVQAYHEADRRLREAHRDEFEQYYAEEKAKRGLA